MLTAIFALLPFFLAAGFYLAWDDKKTITTAELGQRSIAELRMEEAARQRAAEREAGL